MKQHDPKLTSLDALKASLILLALAWHPLTYAVYNGDLTNSKFSEAVPQITFFDSPNTSTCSSILIRANLLLTNMHCLELGLEDQKIYTQSKKTESGARRAIFKYAYLFGEKNNKPLNNKLAIAGFKLKCKDGSIKLVSTTILPRAVFLPSRSVKKITKYSPPIPLAVDLAILQIKPIRSSKCTEPPRPIELNANLPKTKDEFKKYHEYVIGWGYSNSSPGNHADRRIGMNDEQIDFCPDSPTMQGQKAALCTKGKNPICLGDSGGPSFLVLKDKKISNKAQLSGLLVANYMDSDFSLFNGDNRCSLKYNNNESIYIGAPYFRWINYMKEILPSPAQSYY